MSWCLWGFHKWSKWNVIREGLYRATSSEWRVLGPGNSVFSSVRENSTTKEMTPAMQPTGDKFEEQRRECERCGISQLRTEHA